jgi:hypothetical protein
MIKNDINTRKAVSFEIVIYRNGELQEIKQEFTVMTGDVNRQTLGNHARHLIREGKKETYEMVHGSAFGERVTIERKLGNIVNITEIDDSESKGIDYDLAYAEDSRYRYNG